MLDPITLIENHFFSHPGSTRGREAAQIIWARAQENPTSYCDVFDMLAEAEEEENNFE